MEETRTPHRHLVLVDIENLVGTPAPQVEWIEEAQRSLTERLALTDAAMVVLACSHHAGRTVATAWKGGRRLWRSGRDGADTALLEVLTDEPVAKRCSHVTVVSGDGIFADQLSALASRGVSTQVVATMGRLSRRSRLAAGSVLLLDPWPWMTNDQEAA